MQCILECVEGVKISVKNSCSSYYLFLFWNQYSLFISVRVTHLRDFFKWRGNFSVPSPFWVRQMTWRGSWFTQGRASCLACRTFIGFSYFSVLYVTAPLLSLFVELLAFQWFIWAAHLQLCYSTTHLPFILLPLLEYLSSVSTSPSTFHLPGICWNYLSASGYFLFLFYHISLYLFSFLYWHFNDFWM